MRRPRPRASARSAALEVLRGLDQPQADLSGSLDQIRARLVDPRDRALATDLVLGTLRWRGALDYQLQQFSHRPLGRFDSLVLDVLRLGAYQLLHLDRVPAHAVVHESVDLVKASRLRSAGSLVNAVLRRLARDRGALVWPTSGDVAADLAVVHSHPEWLVRRLLARHGVDATVTWLAFNNATPAVTVAPNLPVNTREQLAERLNLEHIVTSPTRWSPVGLTVESGSIAASVAFQRGGCLFQDEASQLIPFLMPVAAGSHVLDACAAPGGKTIALAGRVGSSGRVVACDVRSRRIQVLVDTVTRCRADTVSVVHVQSAAALPFRDAQFDHVLLDAPCSGLGTLNRDPDIRWRRTEADLERFAKLQRQLIAGAARAVRPGGTLVYSTCSSEPEENEQVVASFLAETPSFRSEPVDRLDLPPGCRSLFSSDGAFRSSPLHGLDAFYGAVLRRDG